MKVLEKKESKSQQYYKSWSRRRESDSNSSSSTLSAFSKQSPLFSPPVKSATPWLLSPLPMTSSSEWIGTSYQTSNCEQQYTKEEWYSHGTATSSNGWCTCTSCCISTTVFAQSDAMATTYFIAQFCAASIQERRLIESSVHWYQWTWPSSPDHSHVFNAYGGSGDGEKSDPYADIEPRTKTD